MGKLLTFLVVFLSAIVSLSAQCGTTETVTVCDMTIVDGDMDGNPDGIINLYEEFSAITGTTITPADGMWFDPNFNFALDAMTGDLSLWNLDNSSENTTDYQFEFLNGSSGCTDDIQYFFNVVLGPYAGDPATPSGPNSVNITVCEAGLGSFDLFQVFDSSPPPHENGVWAFIGNDGDPSNFQSLNQDGMFMATIPYTPNDGNLVDSDVFEFTYTVPGIAPCAPEEVSNFRVEVVRDVDSGIPGSEFLCQSEMVAGGIWDRDIDLAAEYLEGEDVEGTWSSDNDPSGQISNPGDGIINLYEAYVDFVTTNGPAIDCLSFSYTYTVEPRINLANCDEKVSVITFSIAEEIRPFSQDAPYEICVNADSPTSINLYDELTFTTEVWNNPNTGMNEDVLFDYPNENCTNWEFISGPTPIAILSNTGMAPGSTVIDWCSAFVLGTGYTTEYRTAGTINFGGVEPGTYTFRYTVLPSYHCQLAGTCNTDTSCNHPCDIQTADVVVIVNPTNYPGEDTADLEFCESESPIVLTDQLMTNGTDTVYVGPEGTWTDLDTGLEVNNNFDIPEITTGSQVFNLEYVTLTAAGCEESATLSFNVWEQYDPGMGGDVTVCENNGEIDLFTLLTGTPDTNGIWTGPNGYTSDTNVALFDPETDVLGDYTYTVPANGTCDSSAAILTVSFGSTVYAGEDTFDVELCFADIPNPIDMITLINTNGTDTVFTGNGSGFSEVLLGTPVANPFTIPTIDGEETFTFTYTAISDDGCETQSTLSFTVFEQFSAGDDALVEICEDATPINLFDAITGTPDTNGTWSGPNGYATTDNNAPFDPATDVEGEYTYTVPSNGACGEDVTLVTVSFLDTNYAGEDTLDVELCFADIANPIDLIGLIGTNGTDIVYTGPQGEFTEVLSGDPIANPFTIPAFDDEITFTFVYTTTSDDGCGDSATLSFTVFEQYSAGDDASVEICEDAVAIDLFDSLTGMPEANGTWSGPNGYATTDNNAPFDPSVDAEGDYVYTVPSNGACGDDTSTVAVSFFATNYAGEDTFDLELCLGDITNPIDLTTLLATNGTDTVYTGPEGAFTEVLSGDPIANPFTIPTFDDEISFAFVYTTTTANGCGDSATLSFTVFEQYSAGDDATVEICEDAVAINLFDSLTGMPEANGTWSGPNGYATTDNNAPFDPSVDAEGDYVYTVPSNGACGEDTSTVTVSFFATNYAGEDTLDLELCLGDITNPIDLTTLLATNGTDTVYTGPLGQFTEVLSGDPIANPFTIPAFDDEISFAFVYTTTTADGCGDSATLSFTVFEQYSAGSGTSFEICADQGSVNLFDSLTDTPDTNGTWSGPDGYTANGDTAIIDVATAESGDYIYTTPVNGACAAATATVSVTISQLPNAGEDIDTFLCPGDYTVDLNTQIAATADAGGEFINLETGITVVDGQLQVGDLEAGETSFIYVVSNGSCADDSVTLTFTITPVAAPSVQGQTFCITLGATLQSLTVENASNFQWYDSLTSTESLPLTTVLVDNEDYYVSNSDANGCESTRVQYVADILAIGEGTCDIGISDGVSDNGDGTNDQLELGGLPSAFPEFEIQIFNRYGNVVYRGGVNTPLFSGSSNTGSNNGKQLPTGVYFYVFNPNSPNASPIDGNFYLSR